MVLLGLLVPWLGVQEVLSPGQELLLPVLDLGDGQPALAGCLLGARLTLEGA